MHKGIFSYLCRREETRASFSYPIQISKDIWLNYMDDRLSWWLSGKEFTCSGDAGDASSIPALERSPGEGNGNPLQYSCLENPMDRGAWRVSSWGCKESDVT